MNRLLRHALIPKLREAFVSQAMRLQPEGEFLAVFTSKHPEVGDVVVQDDGDELTVFIGSFTHTHFGNYDDALSEVQKAEAISNNVVDFLERLFRDEIEFFGTGASGGSRDRSVADRGLLSKFFFGRKTYVWSGPLHCDA